MSRLQLVIGCIALIVGFYVGNTILPYHFSEQKPLEMGNLTGEYDFTSDLGNFLGRQVRSTPGSIDELLARTNTNVLGATNKRIEIDLTSQRIYAFEGDRKIYDFLISSGKWAPTPTGTFNIWIKLRYTKMEGGNKALRTYYYLPNVPYVMYFASSEIPSWRGFGIHGAYWHNNFGHPMSHGCVNMKPEEAGKIYYWADPDLRGKSSIRASDDNPGTQVIIYGQAPKT